MHDFIRLWLVQGATYKIGMFLMHTENGESD